MGVAKPTGGYAEQMLDPGGWPDVDEQALYDRAQQYTQVLRQVTDVLETCRHQQAEIVDGGIWSGSAAGAANGELGTLSGEMTTLQNGLATVITWHKHIAVTIVQAKSDVTDNVVEAHRTIDALKNDPSLDAAELTKQINTVMSAAHEANVSIVDGTAAQILVSKAWKPPANALQDLLDQKTPPPVTIPDTPPVQPSPADPRTRPAQPVPGTPETGGPRPPVTPGTGRPTPPVTPGTERPTPPVTPGTERPTPPVTPGTERPTPPVTPGTERPTPPVTPGTGRPTPPVTPGTGRPTPPTVTPPVDGGVLQPTPGTPPTPGQPGVPTVPNPAGPGPTVPGVAPGGGPGAPLGPAAPAAPSPAAGAPQPGAGEGGGKGVTPAAASAGVLPASAKPAEESSAGAQAGAAGMPAGAMGSGGSGGSSGAGSGAKSGAPVGRKPADKAAPSTRPAASKAAGKSKPRVQPQHAEHTEVEQSVVVTPAPVIPVSAARARRDAIAEAGTADAARRAGPDPLQLARRIAAALNAPGVGGRMDLGFFWVTGVTTDGAIVVANSYGLAYIPEGVQLPEKVHMASGDETIPATERAHWATYPVMALRGWADHHDKKLRAVIGTEKQLANSDPGVATVVLKPDDIPENGDMFGRSRLEVVDSEAADRLAATTDASLVDLLPPAPAGAEPAADQQPAPAELVDPEAAAVLVSPTPGVMGMGQSPAQELPLLAGVDSPGDDRLILWFEVMKPLASNATGRQAAHLRAFRTYAACAEEVTLREAHTTVDPAARRSAVAEWLYWNHLTGLLNAALADPRILNPA
jgi:hypothetical protein